LSEQPKTYRWRDRDIDNKLMLELSSTNPSESRLRELVSEGADVNSVHMEESVIMQTISFIQDGLDPRFVYMLVELGADVNYAPDDGCGPLFEACLVFKPEIVEFLLQRGANPNVITDYHETILEWVQWDQDYHKSEACGDKNSFDAHASRVLGEIVGILKKYGAVKLEDLWTKNVSRWLHVFAAYPTGLMTSTGNIEIDGLPEASDELKRDFKIWWAEDWEHWPDKPRSMSLNEMRRHNDRGRQLAKEIRKLFPPAISMRFLGGDAVDEDNPINVFNERVV